MPVSLILCFAAVLATMERTGSVGSIYFERVEQILKCEQPSVTIFWSKENFEY